MSDIRKILEAMAALANATLANYVTVIKYGADSFGIGLSHNTDEAARETANALDVELGNVGNANESWLAGECHLGDIRCSVYGPHHKRVVKADAAAIEAALAEAQEALS